MVIRNSVTALLLTAALLPLPACDSHVGVHTDGGSLTFDGDDLVIAGKGTAKARVAADGSLTIGGAAVAVTDGQRADLIRLRKGAEQMVQHGFDTGKAGVRVGTAAAGAALESIARGDSKGVQAAVDEKVKIVKQSVGRLCDDLGAVRDAEQAVAAALPAFRPYVTTSAADVADCRKGASSDP